MFLIIYIYFILSASLLISEESNNQSKLLLPDQIDQAEKESQKKFSQRFEVFTQDKNIQGAPVDPNGKEISATVKSKKNSDNKLPFQSDLTHHKKTFNVVNTVKDEKNNETKTEKIFAFQSDHGKIAAGGGSSQLERVAFQKGQELSKKDDENKKNGKDDEDLKNGIKKFDIFKLTTTDVTVDKNGVVAKEGANENSNDKKNDENKPKKVAVQRMEIREEARKDIEKVGEDSSDTILSASRDTDKKNDPNALGNSVLLLKAAQDGLKGLWNNTMGALYQRRMNQAIRGGALGQGPQLSEDVPSCDEYSKILQNDINNQLKDEKSKSRREELTKEVERQVKQCKEIAKSDYRDINPRFRFKENKNAKKEDPKFEEKLAFEGPKREDVFERDMRVQLEVLSSAGTKASDVPSNWKYSDKDDRARVTLRDENGNKTEKNLTVSEQLDGYNNQLEAADKGYEQVQNLIPNFQKPDPTQYKIPEGVSMLDIVRPPAQAMEEFGVTKPVEDKAAQNYDELLKQ